MKCKEVELKKKKNKKTVNKGTKKGGLKKLMSKLRTKSFQVLKITK
jgi:hypothetical protein